MVDFERRGSAPQNIATEQSLLGGAKEVSFSAAISACEKGGQWPLALFLLRLGLFSMPKNPPLRILTKPHENRMNVTYCRTYSRNCGRFAKLYGIVRICQHGYTRFADKNVRKHDFLNLTLSINDENRKEPDARSESGAK